MYNLTRRGRLALVSGRIFAPTTEAEPTAITFLVKADTISPVLARVGQLIVCNPFGRSHILMVIVREANGRIVGTVNRSSVNPLPQLLELEAQGVLVREVRS